MSTVAWESIPIPPDIQEFCERHRMPYFAEFVYRSGFASGWRSALNKPPMPPRGGRLSLRQKGMLGDLGIFGSMPCAEKSRVARNLVRKGLAGWNGPETLVITALGRERLGLPAVPGAMPPAMNWEPVAAIPPT